MRLSALLTASGLDADVSSNPSVRDVSEDSREITPGMLFVAVQGNDRDGMEYVDDAVARGAVGVISDRPAKVSVPVIQVHDTRSALADLAAAVHGFPARKLRAYGITGTDGKTTTSYLLQSILEAAGLQTGMMSTVETIVAGKSVRGMDRLTTPSASYIQRTLAAMVAAGDQCVVLECSSHALAQQRLRNVSMRGAAITNIMSDHLSFHGSVEAYMDAKASISKLLDEGERPALWINRDDPRSVQVASRTTGAIHFYGLDEASELKASNIQSTLTTTSFRATTTKAEVIIELPMGGDYNVHNALAAIGLSMSEDVDLTLAARALSTARAPRGRLERIDVGQLFDVFVDYAHTEQAFKNVLQFAKAQSTRRGGRLIGIFGAAGDRDRAKRGFFGRTGATYYDYFVVTTEDPFGEDAEAIIAEIVAGIPAEVNDWSKVSDRREAIREGLNRARPGDVVLITGKGHESSIDVAGHRQMWSDTEVTKALLKEMLGIAEEETGRVVFGA